MQSALGFERQLPFNTTVAITYANTHGLHMLRSRNINAPLPGTSTAFPFGPAGPIFLMESSGLYNQNQVIANVNSRVNQRVSLFGSYVYNRARSNTDGLNTFPGESIQLLGGVRSRFHRYPPSRFAWAAPWRRSGASGSIPCS